MVDALYAAARAPRAGDAQAVRRTLSPPLFPAGGEATLALLELPFALALLFVVVMRRVAADRALELAQTLPDRATEVGQALGPQHDQSDHEHDDDLEWSDVGHEALLLGVVSA